MDALNGKTLEEDARAVIDQLNTGLSALCRTKCFRFLERVRNSRDVPKNICESYMACCQAACHVGDDNSRNFDEMNGFKERAETSLDELRSKGGNDEFKYLVDIAQQATELAIKKFDEIIAKPVEVEVHVDSSKKYEMDSNGNVSLRVSLIYGEGVNKLAPSATDIDIQIYVGDGGSLPCRVEHRDKLSVNSTSFIPFSIPLSKEIWQMGRGGGTIKLSYCSYWSGRQTKELKFDFGFICPLKKTDYPKYGLGEATRDRFVGREDLLSRMRELFSRENGSVGFLLTGMRSSGKSSFLKQLQFELPEKEFLVTYVTLYDFKCGCVQSPFELLLREIEKCMKRMRPEFKPCTDDEPWDKRLENVRSFVAASRRRWVLAIDEYQKLYMGFNALERLGQELVDEVAKQLRALLSRDVAHIVIAAQPFITQFNVCPNYFRPFYRQRITYFRKQDIARLLTLVDPDTHSESVRRIARRFDDDVVDWLFDLSGGNPFHAQKICVQLIEAMKDDEKYMLTVNDCRRLEPRFFEDDDEMFNAGDFESFFGLESGEWPDEEELLNFYYDLACSTEREIMQSEMDGAFGQKVDDLYSREIVAKTVGDGCVRVRLRSRLFEGWLQKRNRQRLSVVTFVGGKMGRCW